MHSIEKLSRCWYGVSWAWWAEGWTTQSKVLLKRIGPMSYGACQCGAKPLKTWHFKDFLCSPITKKFTLPLENPFQYRNQSFKCYSTSLAPPYKCSITSSLSFWLVWYVTLLIVIRGHPFALCSFSTSWQSKNTKKRYWYVQFTTIGHNTCPMVASNGF